MVCSAPNCEGHFAPFELARRVAELGRRYGQSDVLAVERNNHGFGVLAHLNRQNMEYA